jgi:hypothetical protein
MSRLVDPMSEEAYEKLSKQEKWFMDHPYIILAGIVTGLICLGIVGEFIKRIFS